MSLVTQRTGSPQSLSTCPSVQWKAVQKDTELSMGKPSIQQLIHQPTWSRPQTQSDLLPIVHQSRMVAKRPLPVFPATVALSHPTGDRGDLRRCIDQPQMGNRMEWQDMEDWQIHTGLSFKFDCWPRLPQIYGLHFALGSGFHRIFGIFQVATQCGGMWHPWVLSGNLPAWWLLKPTWKLCDPWTVP